MKKLVTGLMLCTFLVACGGTAPFGGKTTDVDGEGDVAAIPEVLAGNLQSFTYNAANGTLSISGIAGDGNAVNGAYLRSPTLDRPGYDAYSAQDASNGRHSTVYIRDIDGTSAVLVATGVQYEHLYAGGAYTNAAYSPRVAPDSNDPNSGLVYYTGRYIGLLNGPGSNEDVTTPNPGEDPSVLTAQAAEVTGDVQITADFATQNVDGIVYNRVVPDIDAAGNLDTNSANPLMAEDIALQGTAIATDGTFLGVAEQKNSSVGDYGGIFGGIGATEVAGVVHVKDHISVISEEEEFGIFVLGECEPPLSGPDCNLTP
ncbi:MAG: thymidylate synthase [Sulfitobacter sp.]